MTKTDGQFQKDQRKSVRRVALTRTFLYSCIEFALEKKNVWKKSKNNLMIVKKAHAYVQTIILNSC